MAITTTNPTVTPSAPQWLRDLVTARTRYEELLGWPVTVDVEPRRLAMAVGRVLDAVTMPSPLGEKVLAELGSAMLAGPVIAGLGGAWWTFLSEPATSSRPDIPADLHVRKVRLTPRGAHVIIPSLVDGEGPSRWVRPPRPHHQLPPWSVVIGATRRVADWMELPEVIDPPLTHPILHACLEVPDERYPNRSRTWTVTATIGNRGHR